MRLLLDAHISRAMLSHLEGLGHDCVHAAMLMPRMSDTELLEMALKDRRVIVTADKDFGDLIFRRQVPALGVVLLRLTMATEAARLERFCAAWGHVERVVVGHFVVVTNRSIRRSPIP